MKTKKIVKLISLVLSFVFAPIYGSNQVNYNPLMTKHVMSKKILRDEKFYLIDVGARSGIAKYWNVFGNTLEGVGFDPVIYECERLNSINPLSNFTYIPCYIIAEQPEIDNYQSDIQRAFGARSSSYRYLKNFKQNYAEKYHNLDRNTKLSDIKISLDRYVKENSIQRVDFIKIDTDGCDFAVLKGAEQLLEDDQLLGLYVECQFHGDAHPYSNTFRNIDTILVEKGFTLFDLSMWHYSKGALPARFLFGVPAQTVSGQLSWGDALYLRDLVYLKKKGHQFSSLQVIKMACLHEIFGMPDCAAEILLAFQDQLNEVIDVKHCLDQLAKDMKLYNNYNTHIEQFLSKPQAFLPKK